MSAQRLLRLLTLFGLVGLLARPARADSITNGGFETGDLTGWTPFVTANGSGLPDVISFNATGTGASFAAHFDVGEVTFTGLLQEGGGLTQTVVVPVAGLYTTTAAIASQDDADGQVNGAAGVFSILIDGTLVASDDLGGFSSSFQILRGSLSGSINLAAGPQTFEILITRPYLSGGTATPDEYVDNVTLGKVPEPCTLTLFGTAMAALGLLVRRRKKV
jgi:hypothetical protein